MRKRITRQPVVSSMHPQHKIFTQILLFNTLRTKACTVSILGGRGACNFATHTHTHNRFIHFGRGKPIPLTPDSSNADILGETSNTGKVVVTKSITKIVKASSIQINDKDDYRGANGRMMQRKKKGRLFSLGGNEPPRRKRGRLDRLKTVGTFDLGIDVILDESSDSNEPQPQSQQKQDDATSTPQRSRRMSANAIFARNGSNEEHTTHYQRSSITPGTVRREIQKNVFPKRLASRDSKQSISSNTSSPSTRRSHSESDRSNQPNASAYEESTDKTKLSMDQSRACSSSTSTISSKYVASAIMPHRKSPNKQLTNHTKKSDHKAIKYAADVSATGKDRPIDAPSDNEVTLEKCPYKPRKPVLRKSKRIVRTDSEVFDELPSVSPVDDVCSQEITCAQVHNEPESAEPAESAESSEPAEPAKPAEPAEPADPTEFIEPADVDTTTDTLTPMDVSNQSNDVTDAAIEPEGIELIIVDSADDMKTTTDGCDNESSDSTCDLDKLERDYRELARSNLQREYKSDGDSLDEVGRKRSDFQNWKNQSFETNFEIYGKNKNKPAHSMDYMEEADKIEILERNESLSDLNSGQYAHDENLLLSSDNYSESIINQQNAQAPHDDAFAELLSNSSSELKSPRSDMESGSEKQQSSAAIGERLDSERTINLILNTTTAKIPTPHRRPSKLDIKADTKTDTTSSTSTASTKEKTIFGLLEKRFGKLSKINKLLKLKSAGGVDDDSPAKQAKQTKHLKKVAKDSSSSTSTQNSVQSAVGVAQIETDPVNLTHKDANPEQTPRMFKPRSSPGKSSTTDSKSSVYSSKYSLFSSIASKSSIFQKKSAMISHSSRSNNELNMRVSSRSGLTEVSKSNSEINRCRMSPMRYSTKRSIKQNKPSSASCVYTEANHSPLSEEFYNKTGSVRLSAIELYHKFLLEDFVGLYKQELAKVSPLHECRRRYAKGKDAHLKKQRSEPKFIFRQESSYHDPKEGIYDFLHHTTWSLNFPVFRSHYTQQFLISEYLQKTKTTISRRSSRMKVTLKLYFFN